MHYIIKCNYRSGSRHVFSRQLEVGHSCEKYLLPWKSYLWLEAQQNLSFLDIWGRRLLPYLPGPEVHINTGQNADRSIYARYQDHVWTNSPQKLNYLACCSTRFIDEQIWCGRTTYKACQCRIRLALAMGNIRLSVVSVRTRPDHIQRSHIARTERCKFCGNTATIRSCLDFPRVWRSGISPDMVIHWRKIFVPGSNLRATPYLYVPLT